MLDATKRIIKKYGKEKCMEAYRLYDDGNMGGRNVGYMMGVSTNTADALINAAMDIIKNQNKQS